MSDLTLHCSRIHRAPNRIEISYPWRFEREPVVVAVSAFLFPFILGSWWVLGRIIMLSGNAAGSESFDPRSFLTIIFVANALYSVLLYGVVAHFANRVTWVLEKDEISARVGPLPWRRPLLPTYSPQDCTRIRLKSMRHTARIRWEGVVRYRSHRIYLEGDDLSFEIHYTRHRNSALDLVTALKDFYGLEFVQEES